MDQVYFTNDLFSTNLHALKAAYLDPFLKAKLSAAICALYFRNLM